MSVTIGMKGSAEALEMCIRDSVYTMESGAVHARQMERMGLVLTT